jgi:hypothetical protein
MAPSRWVVNGSPLILLGKSEQLGLLGALTDHIAVPRVVAREVGAPARQRGLAWPQHMVTRGPASLGDPDPAPRLDRPIAPD